MTRRRARVGVIGAGWWATRVHLPALAEYERADLVAVVDADEERATAAAATFGAPHAFTDTGDLFDVGVDAVLIATPHHTHHQLTTAALQAGADVLVEKPMVLDPDDGRRLVALADAVGRRLHVGYPYPHCALAQRLRAAIVGEELGQLQLVTCVFATPAGALYADGTRWPGGVDSLVGPDPATWNRVEVGGGQAHGQLTHAISLVLFCTGLDIEEVTAHTANCGFAVDLVDTASFRAAGGTIGTMATSGGVALGRPTVEAINVFGTNGQATYDMSGGTLRIVTGGGEVEDHGPLTGDQRFPERAPARALVDDFLNGTAPLADGRLGLDAAVFVDGVLRSATIGRPITLTASTPAQTVSGEGGAR